MKIQFLASVALFATALSGCTAAQIAVPSDVAASTERLELDGIGGWQDGRFKLGASQGRFSRRALETRAFDTFVHKAGSGRFEVTGPELGGTASGDCRFSEREIDLDVAVVPDGRLAYRCLFHRNGRQVDGGLFLAEVPNGSGLLAGRTRAGELRIGPLSVDVRPIHHLAGGKVPAGTPLGYAFDVGGRQVGAVDLNGTTKTIYAPRQPGPVRDAVLVASLALSVFWDPGE